LIAAGEASGHLPEIVQRLADNLTHSKKLRDKLISDLTYPAVLALTITIVLWVIFSKVLPRLTPMFAEAGAALPLPTRMLVGLAWFFDSFGWALFALLLSALVALIYSLRNQHRRLQIDRLLITKRWFLGIPERYEAARFCRILQTLLSGGLPLDRALLAARDGSGNSWFREQLVTIQRRVSDGDRLGRALASLAFMPPLVVEFANVGEETGRLQAMMGEAATILDHDVETKLSRLSALVLPGATLILGALVGSIMAGIVSGMIAVNNLAG
jgi:general secretion pathway protein F